MLMRTGLYSRLTLGVYCSTSGGLGVGLVQMILVLRALFLDLGLGLRFSFCPQRLMPDASINDARDAWFLAAGANDAHEARLVPALGAVWAVADVAHDERLVLALGAAKAWAGAKAPVMHASFWRWVRLVWADAYRADGLCIVLALWGGLGGRLAHMMSIVHDFGSILGLRWGTRWS